MTEDRYDQLVEHLKVLTRELEQAVLNLQYAQDEVYWIEQEISEVTEDMGDTKTD